MFLVSSDRDAFIETWKLLLHPVEVHDPKTLTRLLTATPPPLPALTVLDGSRFQKQALHANGELAEIARRTRLLLADAEFDAEAELAALSLGVVACCQPQLSADELRKIVDVVLKGGIWVSRGALPGMLNHLRQATQASPPMEETARKLDNLTPREREIATCVAEGASNKTIAKQLNVSDVTVKAHLTTIFHKLGISGRLQLALLLSDLKHRPPQPPQRAA